MLMYPRITKYKKHQKGNFFNKFKNIITLDKLQNKKTIRLIATENSRITAKQLYAVHATLRKIIKKKGFAILNVFPHTPVTKKPAEVRMGKGKGNVSFWTSNVNIGVTIFNLTIQKKNRLKILKQLSKIRVRLPFLTKIFFN